MDIYRPHTLLDILNLFGVRLKGKRIYYLLILIDKGGEHECIGHGGTGFIGAALVQLLLERDEKYIVAFHRNQAKKTLDDVSDGLVMVQGDLGIFSHVLEAVKNHRPRII